MNQEFLSSCPSPKFEPLSHLFGGVLYRLDDVVIAGTATDVSLEAVANLFFAGLGVATWAQRYVSQEYQRVS